jgi:hypothetical protein
MLQRRLRTYSLVEKHGKNDDHFTPDALRWDLGNRGFCDGVEARLKSHLVVWFGFMLDPEESRRYLNFGRRAWDRETEAWVDTRPEFLISRTVGWTYRSFENLEMERLDKAFECVRREQDVRGLHESSHISDDVQGDLEKVASAMPELKFFYDLVRDWEVVVYLLTHLARGVFGVPMAEALFVRSSGRSGKDTTANLMCALLGSYATSIACDSLCAIPSPDAPSPAFASLRARRFVAVREVAEQKMQASVFKRFVDPVSEISGRNLYDSLVRFKPQYLAFFCSNAPLQMTTMDAAVKARTSVVDYASVFTQMPTEANHAQWRDMSEVVVSYRPGVFWLLQRVYHHLLKGRTMRNVAPVPESCMDAIAISCRERLQELGDSFITNKLCPAKGPSEASLASEIEDAVAQELGIDRASSTLWLQSRGFEKARGWTNGRNSRREYFYRFRFTLQGTKSLTTHYVSLT